MKQTVEDYIRQDKEFRKTLLEQGGGIMKFWAQHPDAEFDANLFKNYENQIVKEYLQANKRNRDVVSLPENELKMEARSWNHHTEKEIHYKVALQPLMTDLPVGVREQVNSYIDDYLADAYRDYRRCYYPNGITPLAFYDEVVKQFGAGGLARDCMDYVLREHHHPEVWAKKKSEYALMTEFFIQQYSEVIGKDAFKMLRQAVKEKLAGKNPEECRREAIKTMNLVKRFSRMIYSSSEDGIFDCTGHYIVDKDFLRELASGYTMLRNNANVPPLHECFFNYVSLLNDIGRIWAARLLKDCCIDMHGLEKETGAILYPVTKPLQNPDGAVHGNYKYYVDKDLNDSLDDQCCIYDEKQAKELLDAMRNNKRAENHASQLKDSIMQLVDNINKNPELVMNLGKLVVTSKFDWSFMKTIICGLSEKWLMDKAIQVIVDKWSEYASRKDEICYKIEAYTTMYEADEHGLYSRQVPMIKTLKYTFLERDLKSVRDGELERREVDAKFNKMKVNPELLVLRAVASQDDTKYEDLEDYEIKAILEKLKGEGYIDAMWIHGQKLPWVCKMLDKGRVYLKKLEEGEIVPPSDEQLDGTPYEDEQDNTFSTEIDNQTHDENIKDWDLFKDWILKNVVIEAIKNIPVGEVTGEVKRHFVIHKVLNEIGWLRHKQATRYVGLMKYHKVVDFAAVDFRDNDLKPFKKIKTTEWGSHLTPDSDLGGKYRKFADTVRNTFTRIIDEQLDDLKIFYTPGKRKYNQVIADNS